MQEKTYKINYWYDNINPKNRYEFKLMKTVEATGYLDEEITDVPDYMDGFYFRTKDNLPITLSLNDKLNTVNIYYSAAYREDIYTLATDSLIDSVAYGDTNVFYKLLACVYGDLYMQARHIDDVINVDEVDEEHLRHLAKLIDYQWSEALTADEQRESIKFYTLLRRMRGTAFAITNLIRIFGQSTDTLYQPTDSTGVRIIDYFEGNELGMYPGDIRVEIPEMSQILRDAIEDVKLMGTRLVFAYRLPIDTEYYDEYGVLRGYHPNVSWMNTLTYWLQPGTRGWDKPIDKDKVILDNSDNKFIYKYRDTYNLHVSSQVKATLSVPYTNVWMFQLYGLRDIRGMVLNDGVIDENLFLYR